jgi:hypothetical protein
MFAHVRNIDDNKKIIIKIKRKNNSKENCKIKRNGVLV